MALFDFAKDILGVGSAVSGIVGMFGRKGKSDAEKQMGAQMERANQLSQALTNYSDPMRARIREEQLSKSRDARLGSIRDYITASTRAARRLPMGPGFIARNPRRDEALMRALQEMGQNEMAGADEAARREISGALTGNIQASQASSRAIPLAWEGQARRGTVLPSAFAAGRDLAGALQRITDGWAAPVATTINDPNALGPAQRSVNTRATGGLLGWV